MVCRRTQIQTLSSLVPLQCECEEIFGVDTINVNTQNAMRSLFFRVEKGGHSQSTTLQSPWHPGSVGLLWLKRRSYSNSLQLLKCWLIWWQSIDGFSKCVPSKAEEPRKESSGVIMCHKYLASQWGGNQPVSCTLICLPPFSLGWIKPSPWEGCLKLSPFIPSLHYPSTLAIFLVSLWTVPLTQPCRLCLANRSLASA